MRRSILTLLLINILFLSTAQELQKGISLYDKGELDRAKDIFDDIKSSSVQYEKAQYYLGRIAFDQEEYKDAVGYFKDAIDENETNSDYYNWLGNSYGRWAQNASKIKQGMLAPKIKKNYEKAVKYDPQNLDARWGLVEYYTQAPAIMGGSWEKAETTANGMLAFDKKEGYRALATVFERKEDFVKAEEAYVNLVQIDPAYRMTLGIFYQNRSKFDQAFDLFEKHYGESEENTGALYQIGRTSALSGQQTDKGIEALNKYLSIEVRQGTPSHAAAKMRLGMIYEKSGNTTKAKEFYQASLNDDPEMQLAKDGLKRLK